MTLAEGWFPPLFYPLYAMTDYPDIKDLEKYDEPRLHMECLLKAHLINFDIPVRILIKLEERGIRTLGDLIQQSRESLLKINNIGEISIRRLEDLLTYHKLSFAK